MPVLLEQNIVNFEFADVYNRRPIQRPTGLIPRSKGIHLSGVLAYIGRSIGKVKYNEKLEDEYPLLFALGNSWEEYCVSFYPEIEWQPGEFVLDGIAATCDGLSALTDDEQRLEEFKFTYKSVRYGPDRPDEKQWFDEWSWMHQARFYCAGLGTRVVRWHVMHVRGDYKSFGPVYKQYVVRFSDDEVEQTRRMVVRYAKEAEAAGLAEIGQ